MNKKSIISFRNSFLDNIEKRLNFIVKHYPFLNSQNLKKYRNITEEKEKILIQIYLELSKNSPRLYRYRGEMEINKIQSSLKYSYYQHSEEDHIKSFDEIENFSLLKDLFLKEEPIIPSFMKENMKNEGKEVIQKEFWELEEDPYKSPVDLWDKNLRIYPSQKSFPTGKIKYHKKYEISEPYIFLADPKNLNDPFEKSYKQVDSFIDEIFYDEIFKELREKNKSKYFLCASFSESDNNPQMWGQYAESSKGVILEYSSKELLAEFNQGLYLFPIFYTNNYLKEFERIKEKVKTPLKEIISIFKKIDQPFDFDRLLYLIIEIFSDIKLLFQTIKTQRWSYEKEWKALRILGSHYLGLNENQIPLNSKSLLSIGYVKEKSPIQESLKELIQDIHKKENHFSKDIYYLSNSPSSPNNFSSEGKGFIHAGNIQVQSLIVENNKAYYEEYEKNLKGEKEVKNKTPFFDIYSESFFSPIEKELSEEEFFFKDIFFEETGEIKKIIPVDFFKNNLTIQLSEESSPFFLFKNKIWLRNKDFPVLLKESYFNSLKENLSSYLLWEVTPSLENFNKDLLIEGKKKILDFISPSYLKTQKEKFFIEETYQTFLLDKNLEDLKASLTLDYLFLKQDKDNFQFLNKIIFSKDKSGINLIDFSYKKITLKEENKKEEVKKIIPFFRNNQGWFIFVNSEENPIFIPKDQIRYYEFFHFSKYENQEKTKEAFGFIKNQNNYLFLNKEKSNNIRESFKPKYKKELDDTLRFIINSQGMFRETKKGIREKIYQENILFLDRNLHKGILLQKEKNFIPVFPKEMFLSFYLKEQKEKFPLLNLAFQEIEVEENESIQTKKIIPFYCKKKKGSAFFSPYDKETLLFENFISNKNFYDDCITANKKNIQKEAKEFFKNPHQYILLNLENEKRKDSKNRHYWDIEKKEGFNFKEIFENSPLRKEKNSFILKNNILYKKEEKREVPFLKEEKTPIYYLREKEKGFQKFLKEKLFNSFLFNFIYLEKKNYFEAININFYKKEALECESINNEVYTEYKGARIKILDKYNKKIKTPETKEFFKEFPYSLLRVNHYRKPFIKLKEYVYAPEEKDIYKISKTFTLEEEAWRKNNLL